MNIKLLIKPIEDFLMACILALLLFVPFFAFKAAAKVGYPLCYEMLEVGEKRTRAIKYSGFDLPFFLKFVQHCVAFSLVSRVQISDHGGALSELLVTVYKPLYDEPDCTSVATNKCERLVKAQQRHSRFEVLRVLSKSHSV
jgi:hypothetical protein